MALLGCSTWVMLNTKTRKLSKIPSKMRDKLNDLAPNPNRYDGRCVLHAILHQGLRDPGHPCPNLNGGLIDCSVKCLQCQPAEHSHDRIVLECELQHCSRLPAKGCLDSSLCFCISQGAISSIEHPSLKPCVPGLAENCSSAA